MCTARLLPFNIVGVFIARLPDKYDKIPVVLRKLAITLKWYCGAKGRNPMCQEKRFA
jgi:hypothetical protein